MSTAFRSQLKIRFHNAFPDFTPSSLPSSLYAWTSGRERSAYRGGFWRDQGLRDGPQGLCHIHAPQSQLGVWIHSPQVLLRTQLVPTPPLTLPWPMEVIVVLSGELCLPRVPPSLPPP